MQAEGVFFWSVWARCKSLWERGAPAALCRYAGLRFPAQTHQMVLSLCYLLGHAAAVQRD